MSVSTERPSPARAEVAGYRRGAAVLSVGIASTGVVTYAYFALASHGLTSSQYGGIALLWSAVFVVASILSDKDVDGMLRVLAERGRTLIATRSSSQRSLDEKELGRCAEPYFERVETVPTPTAAVRRARSLGPVLVTGSLYLLADLAHHE